MNVEAYIQSGAVEAYVLGLMDAAETAAMEQLLKEHWVLRKAVDDFGLQLERKLKADALAAPAHVSTALEQRLFGPVATAVRQESREEDEAITKIQEADGDEATDEETAENPAADVVPITTVVRRAPHWLRIAASALLLMLLASLWANVVWYRKARQMQSAYNSLEMQNLTVKAENAKLRKVVDQAQGQLAAVSEAGTKSILLAGTAGFEQHQATVFMNYRTRQVMVMQNNLPPLQPTQVYQLWAIVNGKAISAGLLNNCGGKLCVAKPVLGNVSAYAISVEPAGPEKAASAGEICAMGNVTI